jgi:hypothetical protein
MQDQNSKSVDSGREDKIMNTIVNTSILLMSTFMGGFNELIVNVTGELASGMTETFSGEEAGKEAREKVKQKLPEVNDKMRALISDMRKDIYMQMEQKNKEIAPFMTDPVFDLGPQKVDAYDFGIPKLSSRLDDDTLAQYSYLLVSEDATFAELFGQLMDWLNSLPKAPKDAQNK